MKAKDCPELVEHYRNKITKILSGQIVVPEAKYERILLPDEIHASEIDGLCMYRPFYNRTLDEVPPISLTSALHFLCGRATERMLITKQGHIVVDGVSMEIDDYVEPWGIIEVKAGRSDCDKFDPLNKNPWWINRAAMYCHGHGKKDFGLLVVFMVGNLWSKRFGDNSRTIDMRAWHITFEDWELELKWKEALLRRDMLMDALESGVPNLDAPMPWECKDCNFRGLCAYYNRGKEGTVNALTMGA